MDNEKKAKEFLDYVAKNEKEMRYVLAKNITYNREIFDDVFQDAVIKVYNSILKNGTAVGNFKNYFFTALKWEYVLQDNRQKKHKANAVRDWFDSHDIPDDDGTMEREERHQRVMDATARLRELVTAEFGVWYSEVFFTYHKAKVMEGISYKKVAARLGIPTKQVAFIVRTVKDWIKGNEEIMRMKEELGNGYVHQ